MLKVMRGAAPEAAGQLRALDAVLARLRDRGYPTLLFYLYDDDDIRRLLRARLLELTGPRASQAYLAHMVLRQVDWSLRHHPAATIPPPPPPAATCASPN